MALPMVVETSAELSKIPEVSPVSTSVYHIIYEPSFQSLVFHFGTVCNLSCLGCYCPYERLDFGIVEDAVSSLPGRSAAPEPEHFLTLEEIAALTADLALERAIFIGTEPSLDPALPELAGWLHQRHGSYNILFGNGVRLPDLSDIDEVILSLKAVGPELYRQYTGKSNRQVLEHFKTVYNSGKRLQAECLLIPGLIEAEEVARIARFIAGVSPDITLRIDGYFPVPGRPWRAATADDVEEAAKLAHKHLQTVHYLHSEMPRTGEPPVRLF